MSFNADPASQLSFKPIAGLPPNIAAGDQQHLAFSGADAVSEKNLIRALARSPFRTSCETGDTHGPATLNVECFGKSGEDADWPILLFIHGVCESAETWGVQRLARACLEKRWRLYVLEIEGHGLSSGRRAVCSSFHRLVRHTLDFVKHVMNSSENTKGVPFVLCGDSLGGILAAYGSDLVQSHRAEYGGELDGFLGTALVAPAVGVNPDAVPSCPVVGALRLLSTIMPSAGVLTPVEDPSQYACPSSSRRNFKGHWPLATSKMLLDVTSKTVRLDQAEGRLVLSAPLFVVAGEKDEFIPMESTQDFVDKARTDTKELVWVPEADHALMFDEEKAAFAIKALFEWLEARKYGFMQK